MPEFVATPLPLWAEIVTAVFAVAGAAFAAIGSFGLVRMPSFFRRIHTPTLGATAGVWCVTIATIVYLVDVRPALQQVTGRRRGGGWSSSDGPYGPYNGGR